MDILKILKENSDQEYAKFQSKLTPSVSSDLFIGVRVPILRNIAKEYFKDDDHYRFIKELPHKYYDEYMLHVLLVSLIKDYDECIKEVDRILPYVDNWAVCDIMSPKVFKKNKDKLINEIIRWTKSKDVYTIRFGIEMLQSHYLDDCFKKEYLSIPNIKSDEYYVNMMEAWFYATALTKQWNSTIKLIEDNVLTTWVHNKTIQKAKESYRITIDQKEYLNSLKR